MERALRKVRVADRAWQGWEGRHSLVGVCGSVVCSMGWCVCGSVVWVDRWLFLYVKYIVSLLLRKIKY